MLQIAVINTDTTLTEEISRSIDWEQLGIGRVFIAADMDQAQVIFKKHEINILICDIETSEDKEKDSLSSILKNYPKTETIFIFASADFNYAKKAVELGCIDFVLKPVASADVATAIKKAVSKILDAKTAAEFCRYGEFWSRSQPLLLEHFWFDIMSCTIPRQLESIQKAASERNISFNKEDCFVPVVIAIKQWSDMSFSNISLMEFALKNLASEMITGNGKHGEVIHFSKFYLLAIVSVDSTLGSDMCFLKRHCEDLIEIGRAHV